MADDEILLECRRCGEHKPLDAFANDKRHTKRHGKQSYCRACMKEYNSERNDRPEVREAHNRRRAGGPGAEYARRRRLERPEIDKNATLKYRYNITLNQYNEMLERQGGACAICRRPPEETQPVRGRGRERLHVDHDHSCCPGRRTCGACLRGLVCARCNHMLGHAGDSTEVLIRAVEYLTGFDGVLGLLKAAMGPSLTSVQWERTK